MTILLYIFASIGVIAVLAIAAVLLLVRQWNKEAREDSELE